MKGIGPTFAEHRMDIRLARSLTSALGGDQCIFGYSGLFPDEHSARLIELGEAVHGSCGTTLSSKGRLGYVLVEAYQNIVRHRAGPTGLPAWGEARSLFLLRCRAQGHELFTRNPVTHAQAHKLERILAELQGKDNEKLKELYIEGIQRTSSPGTRGAGLGLIEMVRRAGGTPRWNFDPLDVEHVLFSLFLELGEPDVQAARSFRNDTSLPRLVAEHEVSFFYAGFWTSEVEAALMELAGVERPVRADDSAKREAKWTQLEKLVLPLVPKGGPVVLVLHGDERPVLSIGGLVDQASAGRAGERSRGSDAGICFGTTSDEGMVPAMVHVPW